MENIKEFNIKKNHFSFLRYIFFKGYYFIEILDNQVKNFIYWNKSKDIAPGRLKYWGIKILSESIFFKNSCPDSYEESIIESQHCDKIIILRLKLLIFSNSFLSFEGEEPEPYVKMMMESKTSKSEFFICAFPG